MNKSSALVNRVSQSPVKDPCSSHEPKALHVLVNLSRKRGFKYKNFVLLCVISILNLQLKFRTINSLEFAHLRFIKTLNAGGINLDH